MLVIRHPGAALCKLIPEELIARIMDGGFFQARSLSRVSLIPRSHIIRILTSLYPGGGNLIWQPRQNCCPDL